MTHIVLVTAALATAGAAGCRQVDGALTGTLTIVAPAAPGGGWDQTARAMQRALQQSGLARVVKVVNVPGAGGTIGLAQFARTDHARGDVLMLMGLIMVGAVLTNDSPVTLAQVTPIARLIGEQEMLVVPMESPYRTLAEFLASWRADPGGHAIAGGSAGGTDHMLAGLLARTAGIDPRVINYVPFSGGGESVALLLGNQVAAGINGAGELAAFVRAGKLRPLAVSGDARMPGLDVPTFLEQGVDLSLTNWRGVVAPPGITAEQRAALTTLVDRMHASAEWRRLLEANNWTPMYQAGPEFDAFLRQEDARAATILRSIGLVQ